MQRDELPATRPLDWGKERHKNGQLRVPAENVLRDDRAWAGILRPAQESRRWSASGRLLHAFCENGPEYHS
jgi:hypothetical protein